MNTTDEEDHEATAKTKALRDSRELAGQARSDALVERMRLYRANKAQAM